MRVKVRALRAELSSILSGVRDAPVTVSRHGEDVAVIISPKDYAEFMALRSVYANVPKQRSRSVVSAAMIG